MPEENSGLENLKEANKRSGDSTTDFKALYRIDTFANTAIWMAVITWGLFVLSAFLGILASSKKTFGGIWDNLFFVSMLTNLASLFLGIIGFFRIIIKRRESSGIIRASVAIMLSLALFAVVIPAIQVRPEDHRRLVCANNQKCLAMAIVLYSENHNYTYPTPEHWCDLLAQRKDVCKKFFICPTALYKGDKGPCHYSLNPNCEPNSPANTVLLFETKGGWNQYGGPELLTFDHHDQKGCWVAFKDCHAEFITSEDVGKLRWKAGEPNNVQEDSVK